MHKFNITADCGEISTNCSHRRHFWLNSRRFCGAVEAREFSDQVCLESNRLGCSIVIQMDLILPHIQSKSWAFNTGICRKDRCKDWSFRYQLSESSGIITCQQKQRKKRDTFKQRKSHISTIQFLLTLKTQKVAVKRVFDHFHNGKSKNTKVYSRLLKVHFDRHAISPFSAIHLFKLKDVKYSGKHIFDKLDSRRFKNTKICSGGLNVHFDCHRIAMIIKQKLKSTGTTVQPCCFMCIDTSVQSIFARLSTAHDHGKLRPCAWIHLQ